MWDESDLCECVSHLQRGRGVEWISSELQLGFTKGF